MNDDDIIIDTLPSLLREIATEFGIQVALVLADWRGGRTLYIPGKINAQHIIARKLGLPAAKWLVEHYAASNLRIDRAAKTARYLRNKEIYRRNQAGESLNALAEEYDTTQRNILLIVSRFEGDPTPDLFS